jgi:hypothetical protein
MLSRLFSTNAKILSFRRGSYEQGDLHFELQSMEKLLSSSCLSGFEVSNLMLGMNSKLNRTTDYPELWKSLYDQLTRNLNSYDGRTLATAAWVLRRKRSPSSSLFLSILDRLAGKVDDLELKHLVMATEGTTYQPRKVPEVLVSGLHRRIQHFQGQFTSRDLTQLASNLIKLHKCTLPDVKVYDVIEAEATRLGKALDFRGFATILFACSRVHKKRPSDLCKTTYPYVMEQLDIGSDVAANPIILNSYLLQPRTHDFKEAFAKVAELILNEPNLHLMNTLNLVSYAHCYSKTGYSDEVLAVIEKRMKSSVIAKISSDKSLGVLLYSFFRRPTDKDFLNKQVTDWLMTYKHRVFKIHLKKIIMCKLKNDPHDQDFWHRLNILKQAEFNEKDMLFIKDCRNLLEKYGVDVSRLKVQTRGDLEDDSDDDLDDLV